MDILNDEEFEKSQYRLKRNTAIIVGVMAIVVLALITYVEITKKQHTSNKTESTLVQP